MIYKIRVHPNSSKEKIEEGNEQLQVYVKERAENNKANIAVIKTLSKYFNTSHDKIKLKGLRSKNKFVEIKKD